MRRILLFTLVLSLFTMSALAGNGNNLPPGPRFMLNVIAFDQYPSGDFTGSNRHMIAVQANYSLDQSGNHKNTLVKTNTIALSSSGVDGDFQVMDGNAHPTSEHLMVVSASDMDAGAKALKARFSEPEIAGSISELFKFDSETRVLAISNAVEYISENEKMTIHFRIITDSLDTAESGCRTVLDQMAMIIPDVIRQTFIPGDIETHHPDEVQRVVMDRTDMLCTVVQLGLKEVFTLRYSFADGSYLLKRKRGTDSP